MDVDPSSFEALNGEEEVIPKKVHLADGIDLYVSQGPIIPKTQQGLGIPTSERFFRSKPMFLISIIGPLASTVCLLRAL